MTRFVAGSIALCLGLIGSAFAGDMPAKEPQQTSFRVGVTQVPMFTLTSALAYGSPVETVLVQKDGDGRWQIPDDLTVLFWSGTALEPALGKQLAESGQAAVSLIDAAGVYQLAKRTPAEWKAPKDDSDIDTWGQGYGEVQVIRPEGLIDNNYWLDPLNAMASLEAVKMVFQGLDQRNHWGYQGNSDQIVQALWELDTQVNRLLHDASDQPFVVLQDEFQYLETRYKLTTTPASGSAQDIVNKAKARGATCVVAAKPFDQHLESVLAQAGLKSVVLDPAGRQMATTTGAYFQWFGNLVSDLNGCVTRS
jgi:ABC-type Zn2+ transport system substrate-binding protein/surface adhesin